MRKIAHETGISHQSIRQMTEKELKLNRYELEKVQRLTDYNKRVYLQRCCQHKRRATVQQRERILFTNEKLFIIEEAHNHQNDRI